MALMQADAENKRMDTRYKEGLHRYEPWKLMAAAFGAGAAVIIAATGAAALILRWAGFGQ
jgi:hypothetical protein